MDILSKLESKEIKAEDVAIMAEEDHTLLEHIMYGWHHKKAHVKYPCGKVMIMLSSSAPAMIYPYFDQVKDFLYTETTVLKWNAIATIANLARVDSAQKIDQALPMTLYQFLEDESMITVGNSVLALGIIGAAKPEFATDIAKQILRVQTIERKTEECSKIISGHAITAFCDLYSKTQIQEEIQKFVQKQLDSERKGTAKKAKLFFNKLKKGLI